MMESLYIASFNLKELEQLFNCKIDDDDFYDVIAYQISQQAPEYLIQNIQNFSGSQLRGAIFGLGFTVVGSDELLLPFLTHGDPLVISSALDSLVRLNIQLKLDDLVFLQNHKSPYVRGAALRYLKVILPIDEIYRRLLEASKDDDAIVRQNVADELSELGLKEAIPL
ncbi:HEAT repeat domain-containing protein [Gynuella sunshinyii]|uniref:HEAT repeat n=1 Tax=Gynuella sunshinyii YC6258 TaxID=1445510 RepID=A0A0C5VUM3_9GAMM|nr:HEAT repeat domain-containing protein [Gynuella sunshinyii]AJQ97851.1 hypothetical Protein YC6258_05823 [Gynuella sunshinyii YC6258]